MAAMGKGLSYSGVRSLVNGRGCGLGPCAARARVQSLEVSPGARLLTQPYEGWAVAQGKWHSHNATECEHLSDYRHQRVCVELGGGRAPCHRLGEDLRCVRLRAKYPAPPLALPMPNAEWGHILAYFSAFPPGSQNPAGASDQGVAATLS